MVIDRTQLEEYPFDGEFFTYKYNEDAPLEEQTKEEIIILRTKCDIQESKKSDVFGNISASFNVYFPFDKETGIDIQRGMSFRGSIYNMKVEGEIIGVFPTQMGGCACYVKDNAV